MFRPTESSYPQLPEWTVSCWLNTAVPISLASLRGRVVLLHAFQMLCPGCVAQGLPQVERIQQTFPTSDLAVVGLHTVFEHHEVMTVHALQAFIHEYQWSFPIGVDQPDGRNALPLTMTRYGLRGTPSSIVLDRQGRVRLHHCGPMDDLSLGALLGGLIVERYATDVLRPHTPASTPVETTENTCTQSVCALQGGCDENCCCHPTLGFRGPGSDRAVAQAPRLEYGYLRRRR